MRARASPTNAHTARQQHEHADDHGLADAGVALAAPRVVGRIERQEGRSGASSESLVSSDTSVGLSKLRRLSGSARVVAGAAQRGRASCTRVPLRSRITGIA